jgi:hypothetical protein
MICADTRLKQADAAMGVAYAHLLKATDDSEIRAMLVTSQRRWLAQRDAELGQLDQDQDANNADRRQIVLDAIKSRTQYLSEPSQQDSKLPRLVSVALGQRKFASQFTGGPFAGFDTSCDFLPGSGTYSYGCFATHSYQNKTRVCSVREDWASGSVSETRMVADIANGRARTVATCSIGGGDADGVCPGANADGAPGRWKTQGIPPDTASMAPPAHPQPQLDADIGPDTDDPWLHACLTDTGYPMRDPTSDGESKP